MCFLVTRRCAVAVLWAAVCLLSGQDGQSAGTPRFEDYPVSSFYRGVVKLPDFGSPGQYEGTELRCFGGDPREYAQKQVNFAGHFVIDACTCGSGCHYLFMWDAISGKVFRRLPPGVIDVGPFDSGGGQSVEYKGEEHRADSSLLIVDGCVGDTCDCGTRYYKWNGDAFDLILSQESRLLLRCR